MLPIACAESTDLEVLDVDGTEQTYYPLTVQFNMDHHSSRIELALDYRTIELGEEQAREIAGYYSRVLAAMSAEPRRVMKRCACFRMRNSVVCRGIE
jgi:hypothetical protein